MALPAEKIDRPFSYADYLTWPDDERWEIIEGEPIAMSPAPGRRHQDILRNITIPFLAQRALIREKGCEIYFAPFDVRLPGIGSAAASDEETLTVVQPDLLIVCDEKKLDDRGCRGAPEFIVEILSPSNLRHDLLRKRDLYEASGVLEYWIVHPEERFVIVYKLENGAYGKGQYYEEKDAIVASVIPGIQVKLVEVFE